MFGNRHFELDKKRGDVYLVLTEGVWPAKYLIRMTLTGPHFDSQLDGRHLQRTIT